MDTSYLTLVDFHTHFPIENTLGLDNIPERHPKLVEYTKSRMSRMHKEWSTLPSEPPAKTDAEADAYLDRWAAEVDKYNLERVCFVTANSNDRLAGIVKKYPDKFVGMAHHQLRPGAEVELKRAVEELDLRGYKMLAPLTEYPFEMPELRPVWEYCAEKELPVLIHFGFLGRGGGIVQHPRMSPLSLFEVARDFPEIPFIIPHFGAGYWHDVLALCWSLPNIYIDSSGSNQWIRWVPYKLTLEDLFAQAYETLGPDRMIFGSDSNAFPRGFSVRYLQDQLRICYQLNFPEEDIKKIFGGNAIRLLRLDS